MTTSLLKVIPRKPLKRTLLSSVDDGAPGSETQARGDGPTTDEPPGRSLEDLPSDAYENDKTVQDIRAAKDGNCHLTS
jgi:hypothetical protein